MKQQKHILIIEDELLIAKRLKYYIEDCNYKCAGIAIDYSGAIEILEHKKVDLVLLDIKISGSKSGVEIAKYLNKNHKIPFMFLTSFNDAETLVRLKKLNPIAYINKPINEVTLTTNIDIYFNALQVEQPKLKAVKLGSKILNINLNELVYIEAEHVYLNLYFKSHNKVIRCSLSRFLNEISEYNMIQISRSVAVNPIFISEISKTEIRIQSKSFKISRIYRKELKKYFL